MKLKALHSFLISLNAHLWALVILSAAFVHEQKPPEPERIEVMFLKLPAPQEGGSMTASAKTRSDDARKARRVDRRQAPLRKKRGPQVEYRVRVAKTSAPAPGRESGTWIPASRTHPRKSAVQDCGTRIAGLSPDAMPDADHRPAASGSGTTSKGQWPQNLIDEDGGDTRELVKVIQARIDSVTPLVHASAGPCQTVRGVVHLKFFVNQDGYPGGFRIIASSGVRCLDDEVDNVLHMAEPYPYVAGWIPVTVRFAPRTSI